MENKQIKLKVKTNYSYTPLAKCEVGGDNVNFYGIIVDATFPHASFHKEDKFICTLRVTDPSLPINNKGEAEFISLVFFANKFDQLPVCQRIGDIIRVHRATVGTYKDRKQISVNICFNSSWALFPAVVQNYQEESKASKD